MAIGATNEVSVDFAKDAVTAGPQEALIDPFSEEEAEGEDSSDKDERSGPPPAFWACAAVTGVGLVMGTVFGTMALDDEDKYASNPTDDTKKAGERNAIIADVSFGVAGAAAIAGIIVLVTDRAKKKRAPQDKANLQITPVAGQRAVGLKARVSF